MAQIKCPECSNKISDKAIYCSQCGYKLNQNKENKKETTTITIKKEHTSITTYIIYITIFLAMLALISSDLVFLKTIRSEVTLQQVQFMTFYKGFISSFPSIIINITFLSCILIILSKRYHKLSKLLNLINIITCFILFIYIYNSNYRIGICFYILLILNNIIFLLPRFGKLVDVEINISESDEEKLLKQSKKLEELYEKKKPSKKNSIIIIIFFILEIIALITINIVNQKDIYKETIIQANSEFQIEIINNYINIRKETNTESAILGAVTEGDIYNVLDIIGDNNYIWYKIDYKGTIGYIASPREEPYIKELYKDKLVINIFCTEKEENCAYLLDFITRFQKTNKYNFLINYLDIKDEHNQEIYNKAISYYKDKEIIPYIIIGDTTIVGYNKKNEKNIMEAIHHHKDNTLNIVDLLKKGEKLPELPQIEEDVNKKE